MSYALLQRRPAVPQFNAVPRDNTKPSGLVVLHTAESLTDTVGPDPGAENVLNWIRIRRDPGSYHVLCDADSTVSLVPWSYETFHDTKTNRHSKGISAAVMCIDWPALYRVKHAGYPSRGHAIINRMAAAAADYSAWLEANYGRTVPARRVTRAQAHAGHAGFIGHGESDPGRRTDPGEAFDWSYFMQRYRHHAGQGSPAKPDQVSVTITEEDKEMRFIKNNGRVYVTDGLTRRYVPKTAILAELRALARGKAGEIMAVSADTLSFLTETK